MDKITIAFSFGTMALILCLETATNVCSVSLSENGKMIALKESQSKNSHSNLINVFIKQLCHENNVRLKDIDALSVSAGPGSYTGLRIGLSTAKGICYGLDKPLICLSTLAIMAESAKQQIQENCAYLVPMIDARRMEVFTATYNKKMELIQKERPLIVEQNSFDDLETTGKIILFGNGAQKCKALLNTNKFLFWDSFQHSAKYQGILAENAYINKNFADIAYFEPSYIKPFYSNKKPLQLN